MRPTWCPCVSDADWCLHIFFSYFLFIFYFQAYRESLEVAADELMLQEQALEQRSEKAVVDAEKIAELADHRRELQRAYKDEATRFTRELSELTEQKKTLATQLEEASAALAGHIPGVSRLLGRRL